MSNTDIPAAVYQQATNANRLAWALAANSGDAQKIGEILTDYIEITSESELLPELMSALLLVVTLALEPALLVADKANVDLRAEFVKARNNVNQLAVKNVMENLKGTTTKGADDADPTA